MKRLYAYLVLQFIFCVAYAQADLQKPNIFIITTDGLRWQEVFRGADSKLLSNNKYVSDVPLMEDLYGGQTVEEKRQKLMPFFWSTLERQGQLYGNRNFENKVDVANFTNISYPGYAEMLTGYVDPFLLKNKPKLNPNENVLSYLNRQEAYKNRVVAFSSWNVFPFILNEGKGNVAVNSGYEENDLPGDYFEMIDSVQNNVSEKAPVRYDLLTYLNTQQYIQEHHPKVVFLSLGETDEFGHQARYDQYLKQANQVDKMIGDLWYFVQTDNFYKDNTIFIITTDHGRGKKANKWNTHNILVSGASQTWLALIGPGIDPLGEIKTKNQVYQKQIAATVAEFAGEEFTAKHPVAEPINLAAGRTD